MGRVAIVGMGNHEIPGSLGGKTYFELAFEAGQDGA